MGGWAPFGRSRPEDEGLSRKEVRALEHERLFPSSTIKGRGKDATRKGKEASAQGFFSFGKKVMHDERRDGGKVWKLW